MVDVQVRDEGSLMLLEPLTDSARDWINDNIGNDNGYQPYYPTVAVERRFVPNILEGMLADGLEVAG